MHMLWFKLFPGLKFFWTKLIFILISFVSGYGNEFEKKENNKN